MNAGGVHTVSDGGGRIWNYNGGRFGICGDPHNGPRHNEAGGRQYTGAIVANFTSGSEVDITIHVATNHQGGFTFRLCDVGVTDPATERERLTEECLNANILQRADGDGRWGWLPMGDSTLDWTMRYRLPSGLTCDHCVLQWYWVSGNTCKPPGVPDWALGDILLRPCGPEGPYPEEFWNCADVRITDT